VTAERDPMDPGPPIRCGSCGTPYPLNDGWKLDGTPIRTYSRPRPTGRRGAPNRCEHSVAEAWINGEWKGQAA
jgi:hypothetical protein